MQIKLLHTSNTDLNDIIVHEEIVNWFICETKLSMISIISVRIVTFNKILVAAVEFDNCKNSFVNIICTIVCSKNGVTLPPASSS